MSVCLGLASNVRTVLDTVRTPLVLGDLAEDNWALIEQFFDDPILGTLF
jgi:hypothetical protein